MKTRPSAPFPGCPKGFVGAGGEAEWGGCPPRARGAATPRAVITGKPYPQIEH